MGYQALYREYRPRTFDEVVGQDHVVEALRNSVRNGRIAHAYLFCGTRGTGKTSLAKIFSRAVNCLDPKDGNPCNECSICRGIISERLLDVIEIDAASNNSVDNIRDIRDEVVYLPAEARYKVYIIDEVHMLSTGAFNALLKTLEEPPGHVIFILATTEPQKLPATILSRCQRYDFRRISPGDIYKTLGAICSDLGIAAEEKALRLISKISDGALRDAISILDKCISIKADKLTFADVFDLTGITYAGIAREVITDILEGNIDGIIRQIDKVEKNGTDLKYFISEMIEYLRNLLIATLADEPSELILADEDTIEEINELSGIMGKETILKMIGKMSELGREIKWIQRPRIFIEIALIDMAACGKSGNHGGRKKGRDTEKVCAKEDNALPKDILWDRTIKKLQDDGRRMIASYLAGTELSSEGKKHVIIFAGSDMSKKKIVEKSENLALIREAMLEILDTDDIFLTCGITDDKDLENNVDFSEKGVISFFKDIPVEIIDG